MKDPSLLKMLTSNELTIRAALYTAHTIKNELSIAEAYIISLLFERPCTREELRARINRDRTSQTRILREMKEKDLICTDNANLYHLTSKGLRTYKRIVAIASSYARGSLHR